MRHFLMIFKHCLQLRKKIGEASAALSLNFFEFCVIWHERMIQEPACLDNAIGCFFSPFENCTSSPLKSLQRCLLFLFKALRSLLISLKAPLLVFAFLQFFATQTNALKRLCRQLKNQFCNLCERSEPQLRLILFELKRF